MCSSDLEGTAPGMDADDYFGTYALKKRIPYDDENCYLAIFTYHTDPKEIFFWSKISGTQKKLVLAGAGRHTKANFIDDIYRDIRYRRSAYDGGEMGEVFISIDPIDNQLTISIPIKKGARIGHSIIESIPEIRVLKDNITYAPHGWSTEYSRKLSERNVFADYEIDSDKWFSSACDTWAGAKYFTSANDENIGNKIHVEMRPGSGNVPSNFDKFAPPKYRVFQVILRESAVVQRLL